MRSYIVANGRNDFVTVTASSGHEAANIAAQMKGWKIDELDVIEL